MIAEIQSRVLRPHPATFGMRQQVAVKTGHGVSRRMAKLVTIIICVSIFVVFVFSQVMHWQIAASAKRMENLQSARMDSTSRNIELLAAKARLTSKEYVARLAGEKFGLNVPEPNQIKRL